MKKSERYLDLGKTHKLSTDEPISDTVTYSYKTHFENCKCIFCETKRKQQK